MNSNKIIDEIKALEGREQQKVPWLLGLLTHKDSTVRFVALRTLVHECSVPTLPERLWTMLESEIDDGVLLIIISALSKCHCGSRDSDVVLKFQEAINRVQDDSEGMLEAFEDAKLRIMRGLDTKQIVKMTIEDRHRQLLEINAEIDTTARKGGQT